MNTQDLYLLYKKVGSITTDSRHVHTGDIFLALKGDNFDGNRFAVNALKDGCSYAVVDADPAVLDSTGVFHSRLICVDNTLETYKALARLHRLEFDIPLLAITGTNGKTTTKELISVVLSTSHNVLATEGNFNNDVGVPKTLLRLSHEHDIAIIEMGASHPGDIHTLVETACPTHGLITNVGRAHLEGFGSFEGVKKTKGELYDYLSEHFLPAFVNTKDKDLMEMANERQMKVRPYIKGKVLSANPYLVVEMENGLYLHTHLVGAYNLPNVLAAVSVGLHFGVTEEDIVRAIEGYVPQNNRSQLIENPSNSLIVDAYNANPSSMAVAIENFARMASGREKLLILGDMAELGAESLSEHRKIINLITRFGFSDVWLVGNEFTKTLSSFRCFPNVEEVKKTLSQDIIHDKFILIKGSHSTRLVELVELL